MHETTGFRARSAAIGLAVALVAAGVIAAAGATAHPGLHPKDDHMGGLIVRVNAPKGLAAELPALQWTGTPAVDDETANLVYAGTGCTLASYAPVSKEIKGNIALVDSKVGARDAADRCPTYTYLQKVRAAAAAGAIGLVEIPADGAEPREGAALAGGIPAMNISRTKHALAVRDAALKDPKAVNVTLTDTDPPLQAMSNLPCVNGMAGPFHCQGIDLLSFVPQEDFNGEGISDLWGWTDPKTGDEYVIIGKTNGVGFFRVTNPAAPVYLGELPNPGVLHALWHDMKVYANHAFIVSESEPHGMTVFDLGRLRKAAKPQEWTSDAHYRLTSAAHNVVINERTGYAYIVGGNTGGLAPDACRSGLHMVDIRKPKEPTFAGCYADEGGPGTLLRDSGADDLSPAAYVHDAQCVVYHGPDKRYTGRELCFNAAENKVVIADVTDKSKPATVGILKYDGVFYAHQGWLTEDHRYLLVNDELDEVEGKDPESKHVPQTRTIVLDVADLRKPKVHIQHFHGTHSIDHNNYVKGRYVYQSNYTSGLRVLDTAFIADPSHPRLEQVAFFDTYPWHGNATFDGTWSNYPYFASGTVAVSGIDEGLFLLRLK